MIETWHILISGFTQDQHRACGTEKLWLEMRQLSSPKVCVQRKTWKDDWVGQAEAIHRLREDPRVTIDPKVYVYAYSWGAGHGFTSLARELARRGIEIEHAVLCDPVYRSRLLPTWLPFNPLSMLSTPKIKVPNNRVTWFRQRRNYPRGHDLVAMDGSQIPPATPLSRDHAYMDDAPDYHQAAMRIALRAL